MTFLALLVIGGFIYYVMTPAERDRVQGMAVRAFGGVSKSAIRSQAETEPYRAALRARTRLAFVTMGLAAVNTTIFVSMLAGPGALGDPDTLVRWGGNFGPRTTNGEWGRLLTSIFVHGGMLHLLINVAALVQLGTILERLVGHIAFAGVYFAAGLLASLVGLAASPMLVGAGASGAIFGLYGLLLAAVIWSVLRRTTLVVPLVALKALAPVSVVFVLYSVLSGRLVNSAELTGFGVGLAWGLFTTRGVAERKTPVRLVAAAAATAFLIAAGSALALRGIADVRPEIERILALEERTAAAYQKAVAQFRLGAITARSLAQVIDRTIVPELQAARARFETIEGVPREHQMLVADASEYLRLRDESWRLRSQALQTASMPALRNAERAERASLDALQRIKPPDAR